MNPTSTPDEAAWCTALLPAARLYMRRHVGGPRGDELAQDAIAVLLRAIRDGRIADCDEAGAFLYGTCRNLARADARTEARRDGLGLRIAVDPIEVAAPRVWERDKLLLCLNQLAARARTVVLRTFVDDRDGPEIAAELQMTENHVRVARFRALAALRACMEGQ